MIKVGLKSLNIINCVAALFIFIFTVILSLVMVEDSPRSAFCYVSSIDVGTHTVIRRLLLTLAPSTSDPQTYEDHTPTSTHPQVIAVSMVWSETYAGLPTQPHPIHPQSTWPCTAGNRTMTFDVSIVPR